MSTFDYLVQHARDNVWCTPDQDFQVILAPARISRPEGARNKIEVLWKSIPLPTKTDWYHVYQIGEITPKLLGLLGTINSWTSLQNHANAELVISDVYTTSGMQLPRFETYVLRTRDNNVLVAVKDQPKIVALNRSTLYLRFYSNAYFARATLNKAVDGIEVRGATIISNQHFLQYQAQFRAAKQRKGHTYAFVNGRLVHDVNSTTVKIGDTVEYVWDSSIKCVVEYPINQLRNYHSSLDGKQKYLLHKGDDIGTTIDYRDDIDLFVIKRPTQYTYSGVYYHKNQEDAIRMVTHRDYGIPVSYVNAYATDHAWLGNVMELRVLLHIRESGYNRPLVDEHHRIKELYKLPEKDLINALIGTESSMPLWRAENLEKSFYPAIMRAKGTDITRQMVTRAYGYNAVAKLVADQPLAVNGTGYVELPYGLREQSTIYEYDAAGTMLSWYYHASGTHYVPRNNNCAFVEGMVGIGGYRLPTQYQKASVGMSDALSYRFYVCDIYAGTPKGNWVDVTGTDAVTIQNHTATWNTDPEKQYTAVRSDSHFLAYDLLLDYRDGVLRFTLNCEEQRLDANWHQGPVQIPFAQLDIWLNGRALIENLDYYVQWPEVCLINKEYLNPNAVDGAQRISVRAYGHCAQELTRAEPAEFGFVTTGLLSKNGRYDVRDDKVLRIIAEGRVHDRSALSFSETDTGIRLETVRNGAPYQISEPIVPMRGLTHEETYALRERSQEADNQVEGYLTLRLPEAPEPLPNPIPKLYQIYSPFCSKIMYDLRHGLLDLSAFQGQYSDMAIKEHLESYRWLLAYEPTYKDINYEYVSVHPHNLYTEVALNVNEYRFLMRAVRVFLNDKVDLTRFVKVETN